MQKVNALIKLERYAEAQALLNGELNQFIGKDVLEDLQLAPSEPALFTEPDEDSGTPDPDGLLKAMGFDPVTLDALQARTGLDTATLQARLLELELEGEVGRLPGGLLQRTAQG